MEHVFHCGRICSMMDIYLNTSGLDNYGLLHDGFFSFAVVRQFFLFYLLGC